jgi:hypothetical protein
MFLIRYNLGDRHAHIHMNVGTSNTIFILDSSTLNKFVDSIQQIQSYKVVIYLQEWFQFTEMKRIYNNK